MSAETYEIIQLMMIIVAVLAAIKIMKRK